MPEQVDRAMLGQRIQVSLQKAQQFNASLRTTQTRLLVVGIVSSAAATLVAGVTAAAGPVIGGSGPEGWRFACMVAAGLSFLSTVTTGFTQQFKISERLLQGRECAGRLRALDVALATDSRSWRELTKDYADIVKLYAEMLE